MEKITAISCIKGVVTVIKPDGSIGMYVHPLVMQMSEKDVQKGIEEGNIESNIKDYDNMPIDWEIETEDPEIMGDMSTYYDGDMAGI